MSLGRDHEGRFWWHEGLRRGRHALDSTAHGPFNTPEEAEAHFRITVFGPQCEFKDGGQWDPAWERPQ